MKEIEIRALDLDIEDFESNDEDLKVQGYVATNAASNILGKEGKAKWREVIAPGTFRKAISKAKRLGESIDFLADHDNKKILASTANDSLFLEEDEVGLYFDAVISPTSFGKDLFVLVKDGIIKGLSFGMKVLSEDWSRSSDGMPLRTIHEIELFEISALKTPAYPTTLLEARGLELAEVEVPESLNKKDSEIRALYGGNSMNGDSQEVTPRMIYDAISTLALNQADTNKLLQQIIDAGAVDGLQLAKQVMDQVQQVATATAQNVQPVVGEQVQVPQTEQIDDKANLPKEDVPVEKADEEKPVEDEGKTDEKTDDEEIRADEDVKPSEEKSPEAKPTEKEKPSEDEADKADANEEEKPAAKSDSEDKKPGEEDKDKKAEDEENKQAELRAWLNEHKIVEVPEDGK